MDNKNTTPSADIKSLVAQLEAKCDLYLIKKAPFAIPENIKEMIVKYGPYLSALMIIFSLPVILAALGLTTLLMPLGVLSGAGFNLMSTLGGLVLLITIVLEVVALPGLFKRAASSWRLMFYSTIVNAIYMLLTFNLGGLIIGTILSLYVLFQIKSYYR